MNSSNLSIATIRALGIDTINKAASGHPGMVLGSAPALYTLFTNELNIYNKDSKWFNRDRFVLASGHASALLYSLLHLSGFDVSIDDLKAFRQYESITPGHPEVTITDGVDASSGPLGQGFATAVGMALAEKYLENKFNKEDMSIVDHYTYALCGDGDLQEGISYEASSIAGHLSLGKLIVIYDSNDVTLDGPLSMSFSEDVKKRFDSCGWQVLKVDDGNDTKALLKAIKKAKREKQKPSIIINKTVIGYGSKNQGTNSVHGNPLGKEDGKNAKLSYGFDHDDFFVPEEVYDDFDKNVTKRSKRKYSKWNRLLKSYKENYPNEYQEFIDAINGNFELNINELMNNYSVGYEDATRNTSNEIIQEVAKQNGTYLSGVADLASSVKTEIKNGNMFCPENYLGRNIMFGIREFAMISILNGIYLHSGILASAGGFLVFSDYFKAALRMSAIQELPVIIPLSHDSIAVGEDGPTHQPIEQLNTLRSIPNVHVIRPCDAKETVAAWKMAVESKKNPTCIILTRQNVKCEKDTSYENVTRGGYVVSKEKNKIDAIIIAAGSEVNLAINAQTELLKNGIDVRVVSMPCQEIFNKQDQEYIESVLPKNITKRLAIEMGSPMSWYRYVGLEGKVLGIEKFGASAPAKDVINAYGFTVDNVKKIIEELI